MALIGYARVSRDKQDAEMQIQALRAAGCAKVFVEKACGADKDRPELAAALKHMRSGDTLMAWKLDRLARSVSHTYEIVGALEARGADLRILTQPELDTTTMAGKILFAIMAIMAETERSLIRERTLAGLARARAAGRVGGKYDRASRGLTGPRKQAALPS